MASIGYARVSSEQQSLDIQREALQKAGCEDIFEEKRSGTTREGRRELESMLRPLRKGDVVLVTRIDRLARSLRDLQNVVFEIRKKGAHLRATEQPINTDTAAGKAFLDMLGVFSEFETNLRAERQREGVERRKAAGGYPGRKRKITGAAIKQLMAEGLGAAEIGRKLGCSRQYVYRALKQAA